MKAGIAKLLQQRSALFGLILAAALVSFEMFNYSTTFFALNDLLGEQRFIGIRWATILTIAFCGIDFAGIARIFVHDDDQEDARGMWYLFFAWLLAATMNAMLTWWGVSMAIANRTLVSSVILDASLITHAVPVAVALVVWVTRFLLISTFSFSGRHIFAQADEREEQPPVRPESRQPRVNRDESYPEMPFPTSVRPRPAPRAAQGRNAGGEKAARREGDSPSSSRSQTRYHKL
ncbi:MAG: hypothetical protein VB089_03225 [Anaerolineaceae bacterium]|nr:hypothetical protein [Anaerolineaceae bacterium]